MASTLDTGHDQLAGPLHVAAVDGIVTPEAVVLELDTAGVASRVLAGLVDLAIQCVIFGIGAAAIALSVRSSGDGSGGQTARLVLVAAVLMGYPVLSETLMRGRTLGKRALGLRAVTLEGAPIRFRHAMLRMMGGLVDRLLPPGGITGMLFVIGTTRHQRVGDLLAGTIVIRDPERTALPVAVWFPVPPGLEAFAATIDPAAMTVEQYTVIRSFLMRNRELSSAARFAVAEDLAARAATVVRCAAVGQVHPESFLLCLIARYQRRNFQQYRPTARSLVA
jgi:uncharacterized RDD family membrane protein YckC